MSELKPCPFCGCENVSEQDTGINIPYLLCNDCHAQGPHSFSPALRWNTRAEQSELTTLREQVKVLREALGWLVNEMDCRDDEFGGCLFTRQDFKIARDALERTKPKY